MSTMTTDEAAVQVGVTPATIRSWVLRGHLEPVRRGTKPLRFDEVAVARCFSDRQAPSWHHHLDALWEQVLAQDA